MTPTGELRARLDERGINWWPDKYYRDTNTCWRVGDFEWRASEQKDGKLLIGCTCVKYLTPEQAIAATVGRCDTMELWTEWEQVLFANVTDEVAQDNLNECVHELLEKAATVGAGTCKRVYHPNRTTKKCTCSNCVYGASDERWAYCPKCGHKYVHGEVEERWKKAGRKVAE